MPLGQATSLPEHVVIDFMEEDKKTEVKVDLQDYDHVDPVQLSVYGHRLMGIAEQVGIQLLTVNFRLRRFTDFHLDGRYPQEDLNFVEYQRALRLVSSSNDSRNVDERR